MPAPRPSAPLYTRAFAYACALHFAGGMGLSMFILFPLYVRALGGDELTIGLLAGVANVSAVAIRWPVGRGLDSGRRRLVLLLASGVHVAVWLVLGAAGALNLAMVAGVAVYGIAAGTLFATYFTVASAIIPPARRTEGMAMFGVWGMLPNGLGPALGEYLLAHGGFSLYFSAAAGFAVLALLIAARLRLAPREAPAPAAAPPESDTRFRVRPVASLLLITLVFGLSCNSLFTFLAPYVHETGVAPAGQFFLAYALTAVTVRVLGGRLPDRLGPYWVLLPALICFVAGVASIAAATTPRMLLASGILCGLGHGYTFPILTALVIARTPPSAYGMALSMFTAVFDVGNTIGGPFLGAVARARGYPFMFGLTAALMAIVVAAAWRPRHGLPGGGSTAATSRAA